jgi:hypothetical protein
MQLYEMWDYFLASQEHLRHDHMGELLLVSLGRASGGAFLGGYYVHFRRRAAAFAAQFGSERRFNFGSEH